MRDFKGMKRQRGRNRSGGAPSGGNGGGKPQQNVNRAFDSNGPENVKIRGHAQHVFEKYQQLARDAFSSGDRVVAENYLQHADHYFRVLRTIQPNRPPSEILGRDVFASGLDIDFEDEADGFEDADAGAPDMADANAEPVDGRRYDNGRQENGRQESGRQESGRQDGGRQENGRYEGRQDRVDSRRDQGQERFGQRRDSQDNRSDARSSEGRTQDSRDRDEGRRDIQDTRDYRNDTRRDSTDLRSETRREGQEPRSDRADGRRDFAESTPRESAPRESATRDREPRRDAQANQAEGRRDGRRSDNRRDRDSRYESRTDGERTGGGDRAGEGDPSPVIEPEAAPLPFAASVPEAAPVAGSSTPVAPRALDFEPSTVLRSHDGETSEAPAFLQTAAPTTGQAAQEGEPAKPRTRRRRPKALEDAAAAPIDDGDDA